MKLIALFSFVLGATSFGADVKERDLRYGSDNFASMVRYLDATTGELTSESSDYYVHHAGLYDVKAAKSFEDVIESVLEVLNKKHYDKEEPKSYHVGKSGRGRFDAELFWSPVETQSSPGKYFKPTRVVLEAVQAELEKLVGTENGLHRTQYATFAVGGCTGWLVNQFMKQHWQSQLMTFYNCASSY